VTCSKLCVPGHYIYLSILLPEDVPSSPLTLHHPSQDGGSRIPHRRHRIQKCRKTACYPARAASSRSSEQLFFCYELRFPGGALSFPTLSTPNRDNPGPFLQIAGKVPTVKQIPGELQRIALTKGNVHGGDMSIFGGGLAVQNMACLKAGEEGDLKHIWWQVVIVDVPK
jgi:hypothetical protein